MGVRIIGAGLAATSLALAVGATAMAQEKLPDRPAAAVTAVTTAPRNAGAAAGTVARTAPVSPSALVGQAADVVGELVQGLTCAPLIAGAPDLCSHGADPKAELSASGSGSGHPPAGGSIGCYGNGHDGPRVIAYYAYVQGSPNRFGTYAGSIQQWAAAVDNEINESAAETGGSRHVRWVTDNGSPGCHLLVGQIAVSPTAAQNMTNFIKALSDAGLDQPNRKYLVWMDDDVICGQATVYVDSKPTQDNDNNGAYPSYARVDRSCWDYGEGHELMHMLGGVQPDAPHATKAAHCTDGADIMCYDDGTGARQQVVCSSSHQWRYDCRHDDYFSTKPAAGSWLAAHWNTANSAFLAGAVPAAQPAPAASAGPAPTSNPSPAPSPSPTTAVTTTTGGLVGSAISVVTGLLGSK